MYNQVLECDIRKTHIILFHGFQKDFMQLGKELFTNDIIKKSRFSGCTRIVVLENKFRYAITDIGFTSNDMHTFLCADTDL